MTAGCAPAPPCWGAHDKRTAEAETAQSGPRAAPSDAAARRAQPCGPALHRRGRGRALRAADLRRLRDRAISTALGLREVSLGAARMACGVSRRRADQRDAAASFQRALL